MLRFTDRLRRPARPLGRRAGTTCCRVVACFGRSPSRLAARRGAFVGRAAAGPLVCGYGLSPSSCRWPIRPGTGPSAGLGLCRWSGPWALAGLSVPLGWLRPARRFGFVSLVRGGTGRTLGPSAGAGRLPVCVRPPGRGVLADPSAPPAGSGPSAGSGPGGTGRPYGPLVGLGLCLRSGRSLAGRSAVPVLAWQAGRPYPRRPNRPPRGRLGRRGGSGVVSWTPRPFESVGSIRSAPGRTRLERRERAS